jgi:hypothetical protein
MSAHAPSVAVRTAAVSDEADAALQLDWPLNDMQTSTLYCWWPKVE